ncbi:MAG: hypothetical protein HY544_01515 [Candidatus Diapherotrites archaeon]|uniref:Uncharacterized protein n=1 Tax=Candidatus Iainarchaeum sp. TaxID=3101447 RepID=A0A8T3YPR9_9ARCH|nr:hypothetical protein [Candidatus Diapherotrites archaeon]
MGAPRRPLSRGAETRRWVTGVLARRNEVRGMYSLAKAAVGSAFPPGGSEWQAARARTKMLGDSMAKINYDLQAGLEHRKSWPEALRRLRSRPVAGLRLLRKKIGLEKLFGGISPAARAKERPNAGRGSRAKAAP